MPTASVVAAAVVHAMPLTVHIAESWSQWYNHSHPCTNSSRFLWPGDATKELSKTVWFVTGDQTRA
jgi:hypothetical protein